MRVRVTGRFIFSGLIAGTILVGGVFALGSVMRNGGRMHAADAAHFGGPFELVDQNGAEVTQARFSGRPLVLFFGYTHCQDICSTALADMSLWQAQLGDKAASLPFVFVTVDPERDTPAVLHDYLQNFAGHFIGLSGRVDAVKSMLGEYHIASLPVGRSDGSYDLDHTGGIFLINGDGSLAGTIASHDDLGTGLAKIRRLLLRQMS
ncbi:SCO family protein [Beijerinckia indica]|uniref:Electron transport protein SCO1/SenC n=1 Tax=Beijerinckia indica subsp. indica (strain ATCC 9039 / DSM 1715 / NCIMB 8712) TaxID=395963 RepID=B2IHV0_BEII9|nr:SCO family protein [Beijerinckia indica]ACB95993.1 electron transport protein SCO1/SenC [Beijerinckia indica subsp. indica ATCC 9039]